MASCALPRPARLASRPRFRSFRGTSCSAPWPPQYWRDPFVVGFVVGVITIVGEVVTRGKLTGMSHGHVLVGTLNDLGAPTADFTDCLERFTREKGADFLLEMRNAETVVTYVMNLHPMPDDEDVATATRVAEATTLTGTVGRDEISGALIHMLFTQVVKKRLSASQS